MRKSLLLAATLSLVQLAGALTLTGGVSFFNPSGVEGGGGAMLSLGFGQRVDEMVMATVQIDYFNKTFKKETVVPVDTAAGAIVSVENRRVEFEHSVKYFPLTAGVAVTLPMGGRINPFIEGRLGYGLAHVSYNYSEEVVSASKPNDGTYSGFGWRVGGGARLKLGFRSALLAGVYYNGNTVSKTQAENLFTDLKMSGLGFGAGLELSGF
jgi:opacity protein-like surface antigen